MRILLVEDERDLAEAVAEGLDFDGYSVEIALDGIRASELLAYEKFDLVLLDLNLPGKDGIDILQNLRSHDTETKVLVLSARDAVENRVKGLDAGANDYLVKPFDFAELEARIRNLLRWEFTNRKDTIVAGDLSLDTRTRIIRAHETEIPLRRKELDILETLMLRSGETVSQEELLERAWSSDRNMFSNAVRVHISALRKKLNAALGYDPIQTVVGKGYMLQKNAGEAENE
ncbi:MAG: response regulator transcription factor [Slackia sp.]|nr:response regulator transcription factor [Slackia sp.]